MFDAILLVAYGAPEKLEEVKPFLQSITSGSAIPQARLNAVYERYARFNGVSPLPAEARKLADYMRDATAENDDSRVYLAYIHGSPNVEETLAIAARENARNLLVVPCSAFGSAISCLRYRAFVENARNSLQNENDADLTLAFAPPFYDLPDFQRALADSVLEALAWIDLESGLFDQQTPHNERLLLFTAHSIPVAYAEPSRYARQLLAAADAVARAILAAPAFGGTKPTPRDRATAPFASPAPLADDFAPDLVDAAKRANIRLGFAFQSRSGSPATPWLEPDAREFVREQAASSPRLKSVVAVPIGFFFENMETIYDLDVELKETCDNLNLSYRRAQCVGATERVARALASLAKLDVSDFPKCRAKENACDFSCRAR